MPDLAILAAIIVIGAVVLMATRGDKSSPSSTSFYGDSATYGGWFDLSMVLHRYSPDPVAMVQQIIGRPCINRAVNGLSLQVLITGGTVDSSGLGEGAQVRPLAQQLADDSSPVVVFGCGHVDAMFSAMPAEDFRLLVLHQVELAREAGKTPVLRGLNRFAVNDRVTLDMVARRDRFDAVIREAAETAGVRFIDVGAVPFNGDADICEDSVHGTADYYQRIAHATAQALT